jgi:hypothetical protein
MHKLNRLFAIVTLIFNGISGMVGGYALTTDPSGKSLQMPLYLLDGSPFHNFLVPGLVLLVFIGISSILISYFTIRRKRHYPKMLIGQGAIVWTWLIVEILVIGRLDTLQLVYAIVGLILFLCGAIDMG